MEVGWRKKEKEGALSAQWKNTTMRLKCIAGRGGELKGRVHSGLEASFTPHFLMVLLANDLPQINPCGDAVVNRATVLEYEKSFVAEPKGPCSTRRFPISRTTCKHGGISRDCWRCLYMAWDVRDSLISPRASLVWPVVSEQMIWTRVSSSMRDAYASGTYPRLGASERDGGFVFLTQRSVCVLLRFSARDLTRPPRWLFSTTT